MGSYWSSEVYDEGVYTLEKEELERKLLDESDINGVNKKNIFYYVGIDDFLIKNMFD